MNGPEKPTGVAKAELFFDKHEDRRRFMRSAVNLFNEVFHIREALGINKHQSRLPNNFLDGYASFRRNYGDLKEHMKLMEGAAKSDDGVPDEMVNRAQQLYDRLVTYRDRMERFAIEKGVKFQDSDEEGIETTEGLEVGPMVPVAEKNKNVDGLNLERRKELYREARKHLTEVVGLTEEDAERTLAKSVDLINGTDSKALERYEQVVKNILSRRKDDGSEPHHKETRQSQNLENLVPFDRNTLHTFIREEPIEGDFGPTVLAGVIDQLKELGYSHEEAEQRASILKGIDLEDSQARHQILVAIHKIITKAQSDNVESFVQRQKQQSDVVEAPKTKNGADEDFSPKDIERGKAQQEDLELLRSLKSSVSDSSDNYFASQPQNPGIAGAMSSIIYELERLTREVKYGHKLTAAETQQIRADISDYKKLLKGEVIERGGDKKMGESATPDVPKSPSESTTEETFYSWREGKKAFEGDESYRKDIEDKIDKIISMLPDIDSSLPAMYLGESGEDITLKLENIHKKANELKSLLAQGEERGGMYGDTITVSYSEEQKNKIDSEIGVFVSLVVELDKEVKGLKTYGSDETVEQLFNKQQEEREQKRNELEKERDAYTALKRQMKEAEEEYLGLLRSDQLGNKLRFGLGSFEKSNEAYSRYAKARKVYAAAAKERLTDFMERHKDSRLTFSNERSNATTPTAFKLSEIKLDSAIANKLIIRSGERRLEYQRGLLSPERRKLFGQITEKINFTKSWSPKNKKRFQLAVKAGGYAVAGGLAAFLSGPLAPVFVATGAVAGASAGFGTRWLFDKLAVNKKLEQVALSKRNASEAFSVESIDKLESDYVSNLGSLQSAQTWKKRTSLAAAVAAGLAAGRVGVGQYFLEPETIMTEAPRQPLSSGARAPYVSETPSKAEYPNWTELPKGEAQVLPNFDSQLRGQPENLPVLDGGDLSNPKQTDTGSVWPQGIEDSDTPPSHLEEPPAVAHPEEVPPPPHIESTPAPEPTPEVEQNIPEAEPAVEEAVAAGAIEHTVTEGEYVSAILENRFKAGEFNALLTEFLGEEQASSLSFREFIQKFYATKFDPEFLISQVNLSSGRIDLIYPDEKLNLEPLIRHMYESSPVSAGEIIETPPPRPEASGSVIEPPLPRPTESVGVGVDFEKNSLAASENKRLDLEPKTGEARDELDKVLADMNGPLDKEIASLIKELKPDVAAEIPKETVGVITQDKLGGVEVPSTTKETLVQLGIIDADQQDEIIEKIRHSKTLDIDTLSTDAERILTIVLNTNKLEGNLASSLGVAPQEVSGLMDMNLTKALRFVETHPKFEPLRSLIEARFNWNSVHGGNYENSMLTMRDVLYKLQNNGDMFIKFSGAETTLSPNDQLGKFKFQNIMLKPK